jgi:hypothetical protein
MNKLTIVVPIELIRSDEGVFSLVVTNSAQHQASIDILPAGIVDLQSKIIHEWAEEKVEEAMLKRRSDTGLRDKHGVPVMEGDILRVKLDPPYDFGTAVVKWIPEVAAFVMEGRYATGGGFRTMNLSDAPASEVVGNVFQNPERLTPVNSMRERCAASQSAA